mmetsp:Transcript_16732/g.38623  ORF Transcript_16732/g.38623 Transcript_16732/m.38623 type:complete len:263 (+) Transcript_16732:316-1104(+)
MARPTAAAEGFTAGVANFAASAKDRGSKPANTSEGRSAWAWAWLSTLRPSNVASSTRSKLCQLSALSCSSAIRCCCIGPVAESSSSSACQLAAIACSTSSSEATTAWYQREKPCNAVQKCGLASEMRASSRSNTRISTSSLRISRVCRLAAATKAVKPSTAGTISSSRWTLAREIRTNSSSAPIADTSDAFVELWLPGLPPRLASIVHTTSTSPPVSRSASSYAVLPYRSSARMLSCFCLSRKMTASMFPLEAARWRAVRPS